MTDSELLEIKTAINAAKQYSEDKPNGDYERLLIACIPIMEESIGSLPFEDECLVYFEANALSIARAINHR